MPQIPGMGRAMELLGRARRVTALTGSGLSVASGIPSFRGSQGLWEKYDPFEYASLDSFLARPDKVWEMLRELAATMAQARPNPGHLALTRLQELGRLSSVITQNVDNLHQEAGTKGVIEFHGNGSSLACLECGGRVAAKGVALDKLPPRCPCGGVLKPEVVFFGEAIPEQALMAAIREAESADLMLVIGTSAVVTPASLMPRIAAHKGTPIIEINTERTVLSDSLDCLSLIGPAEVILPGLTQGVGSRAGA